MARKEGLMAAYADEQYRKLQRDGSVHIAFLDRKYLAACEEIADFE
jgi:hypothetical protein